MPSFAEVYTTGCYSTWMDVTPGSSPPARVYTTLAYDTSRQRVVMFGGLTGDDISGGTAVSSADTCEWNGSTWTQLTPPSAPTARNRHAMAYDANRGRVVLHGGTTSGTSAGGTGFNDAWDWNGTAWSQLAVDPPTTTLGAVYPMAYHATHRQAVRTYSGTWTLRLESDRASETCVYGHDADSDGLLGCADPECSAYCEPMCSTLGECAAGRPRCGDGTCSSLETKRLCPSDCRAATSTCGDFLCDGSETAAGCPGDCP